MRESIADQLLSLLTAPKRAASITGDLLEESQSRGASWFWLQVLRTMLSLFCQELLSMPIRMTALIIMGITLDVVGMGFSTFLSRIVDAPQIFYAIGWHPLFNYWWKWSVMLLCGRLLFPFLVGLIVAQFARTKEMVICFALALSMEALVLYNYFTHVFVANWHVPMSVLAVNSWPMIAFLLGGFFVRRRPLHRPSIG